jgi:hypothetical protein
VSVTVGLLVFSAPVLWTSGGDQNIVDLVTSSFPEFDAGGGPATSVPVSAWITGPTPSPGDPWVLLAPPQLFTPAAPATGFANSAGLVVE